MFPLKKVFDTFNFVDSKFTIRMIPWEIKKLVFSNICLAYTVFYFQEIY